MTTTGILSKARFSNSFFNRQADVFFAFTILTVVALLVMPIPTILIDIFICANISVALIVLLLAIYIPNTLKLSTFPTILLLTTLFRLGLNVATSRLILLHADAGEVVTAFGNTVVGGNLVVGIVIFLVLMLINMLVVAKGSERVAEVAARFTLDAMPGKQMSIDADLRSGVLDMEQAKIKRSDLSRESQLFGAMDGAMKFVKGDVIAGIIIFAINIIAGMIIGKLDYGMEIDEALSTYAILSVGDGLVSIIPGLLMSVCAGLIVTRVESTSNKANLGSDIMEQVLSYPKALFIAAFFIGAIGQLPGLPGIPFSVLSLLVLAIALANNNREKLSEAPNSNESSRFDAEPKKSSEALSTRSVEKSSSVVPICIEVSDDLVPLVDDRSNFIDELIPMMRESLETELGLDFPGVRVRLSTEQKLNPSSYILLLNEIPIESGEAKPNECLVAAMKHELQALGIADAETAINPANGTTCSITKLSHKKLLEETGFLVWDAQSRILLHLSQILRKNARDFLTIQETQSMLDKLEQLYPALVKEVIPKAVNLFQLTDILKRLVSEDIPIKDLKSILQALAEYGPLEQNTIALTEFVRTALSRFLCHRFGQGYDTLMVYLLSTEIEDMIRSSIEEQPNGNYLALEPELSQEIIQAIAKEISELPSSARRPIILTSQEIRRFVKKLVEIEYPQITVMSYQELHPDFKVQPIGRINLSHEKAQDEDEPFAEDDEDHFELVPSMPQPS